MDPLLLSVLLASGAVFIGGAAATSIVVERRRVNRNLRNMSTAELDPTDVRASTLAVPAVERLVQPLLKRTGSAARRLTPVGLLERYEKKLDRAGNPEGWDAARIASIRLIGVALAPVLGLAAFASGMDGGRALLVGALVLLMARFGPDALLDGRISSHETEIRNDLPDAIDLMTVSVEAGLGFDAALSLVARETDGALGDELRRVVQQVRLGRSRADALRSMADRIELPELRSLITSLVQAEQFGITIGDVLRSQAAELRLRRRQRAEEHAQKIPVKILVPLIFFILPTVFVVLVGPGILDIIDTL